MPTPPDPAEYTRRLITDARAAGGDPSGWFERVYAEAEGGRAIIPWDGKAAEPLLVDWAEAHAIDGAGRRALVVGSGLGDDAEHVAGLGFDTVAFDVAPSAVRAARRRFPDSRVHYLTADLLRPPADWAQAFDLVVESYTVQSLPDGPRPGAIANIARTVAPAGTLIVVASAREAGSGPRDGPPWPLARAEVEAFATGGVEARPHRVLPQPARIRPGPLAGRAPAPRLSPVTPRPPCPRGVTGRAVRRPPPAPP